MSERAATAAAHAAARAADARAARAALAWGATRTPPVRVQVRENAVYRLVRDDGAVLALRLHRPGYQSRAGIEAELAWTGALARDGLPVPEPAPARDGALTHEVEGQLASAVGWLAGVPVGSSREPLAGSTGDRLALHDGIGRLAARLHAATDRLVTAALPRPRWDRDGLLGERPLWGRFWENPALSADERRLMAEIRAAAGARLDALDARGGGPGAFGLIHADLLRENLLRTAGGLALIDFDDSGYGWRGYDLGTALVQSLEEPDLPDLAEALRAGYAAASGGVAPTTGELVLFTLLRCLASTGWVAGRAAADDARQRLYIARALRLGRAILQGNDRFG